jgi:Predicted dinucleotide-binding enzymes
MEIAIVGLGNVGGALARSFARAGYRVYAGVRDEKEANRAAMENYHHNVSVHMMEEVGVMADTIFFCVVPPAIAEVCQRVGSLEDKVVVDTMNCIHSHPEGYCDTFEALSDIYPECSVVKAFNTTGYENILHPSFGGMAIDTFMAGDDIHAKHLVHRMASDLGFAECYDFGGANTVHLLEELARIWVNLALFQGHGRNIAFKILKRELY